MKIVRVNNENRQEVHKLVFSHMSTEALESFKIHNKVAYDHTVNIINGIKGACFVVQIDSAIAGYLLADHKQIHGSIAYAELCDMRVKQNYQRQGIGSLLVERFIQWAKEEGYDRICVDVSASSEKNLSFYQKQGFIPKTITMERWFH